MKTWQNPSKKPARAEDSLHLQDPENDIQSASDKNADQMIW